MKQVIQKIQEDFNKGNFKNEQSISQGIVFPILKELGWEVFDTQFVSPEFRIGNRRVDFALCSHPQIPICFIECKQPGNTKKADHQLFKYAFHEGVPLAILTDGKTWSFYLPAEQGSYEERRVYKLDILERSIEDSIESLKKYLDFERLKSGQALEEARQEYRNHNRRRIAKKAITQAWKELVDSKNETLTNVINEATEKKCGYKPEPEDVFKFLSGSFVFSPEIPYRGHKVKRPLLSQLPPDSSEGSAPIGNYYIFKGKTYQTKTASEVVIETLKLFAEERNDFFENCYKHPENKGSTRTYIGHSPEELYQNCKIIAKSCELAPGWYLMTNFNNRTKERILLMACKVMSYSIGKEYKYHFK